MDDTDADENEEDAEDDSDGERNGTLSDEEDEEGTVDTCFWLLYFNVSGGRILIQDYPK